MIYPELFLSFLKIGFTSFGGMSMIPLILEEMQRHGWMSVDDMANLVAIAEMTPGPLGINCATFAGTQSAGFLGGLAAVAGVLSPAFSLTLVAALFFERFRESEAMKQIMGFVKPVCIAMILGVILTLSSENYVADGSLRFASIGIGLLMMYLLVRRKWPVPRVLAGAAVLGVICYGVIPAL